MVRICGLMFMGLEAWRLKRTMRMGSCWCENAVQIRPGRHEVSRCCLSEPRSHVNREEVGDIGGSHRRYRAEEFLSQGVVAGYSAKAVLKISK